MCFIYYTSTTMNREQLSLEQEHALQQFEAGQNLFVSGPAGTGKTCLIKQMLASATAHNWKTQVCAMTGCAAILLGCNASTLHSWSGIRLGKGTANEIFDGLKKNSKTLSKWRSTKVLVVDEVSMMSKRLFELLNTLGKIIRKDPRPFGGLQLVFTGDFYQLPPVGSGNEEGSGQFCFESKEWAQTFSLDNHVLLCTVFRQKDPIYKEVLNAIRVGQIAPEHVKLLNQYINRPYDKEAHNGVVPTKLFATHKKVEAINQTMFGALDEQCYEYNCVHKKDCVSYVEANKPLGYDVLAKCKKDLNPKRTEQELEYLMTNCPCERFLQLKKGANVMCTVNLDIESGICNGSIGIIADFVQNAGIPMPVVRFSNGVTRQMPMKYWQSEEYPTLAISQIPLRLAWAMTIHKIQGATLPMAEIDVGMTIFECGQTYVALSRVQSLEGLYLCGFRPDKIRVHPIVKSFYQRIPLVEYEEDDDEEEENESKKKHAELKMESYTCPVDPDVKTIHF